MCGICGVFDRKGGAICPELITNMSAAIQHRGPDGEGHFISGAIGLGHRRLSIIDLEGGSQPIANEDGTIQIIFNGEIYNFIELREELEKYGHIFKTRSDTEVIVHAYEQWGMDSLEKLNGMFAFALWDARSETLILARDHLGIKPLYYVEIGSQLVFASEIKALLRHPACPREIDLEALGQLFTLRYVPAPLTLFHKIRKLPPAHFMIARADGLCVKRFWTWKPQSHRTGDEHALVEEYRALVEDAVRLQMRSDVPVGLFLSSGIDSGALLALMSKSTDQPVRTFTIGFDQGERTNETDDARQLAARFGSDHSEMIVTAGDYQQYYERYLQDLEEPVGNETAAAFHFVSLIARKKVKVALTGQGADEPWAGYHRHLGVKLSEMYSCLPGFLTSGILSPALQRVTTNERVVRGVLSLGEADMLTRLVKVYSFFSSDMKSNLFQPWVKRQISVDGVEAKEALRRLHSDVKDLDPLSQVLYLDTRTNLPDDLLMVGDKTAMANSLEVRVPFLDYRLVEFVETLPPRMKIRGFRGKYLHKVAIEKWLPKAIVHRKKKGFENPIDQWLRKGMRRFVNECLLNSNAAVRKYFEPDYIQKLVAAHEAGERNYLRHLYLLISFELWHQQFLRA